MDWENLTHENVCRKLMNIMWSVTRNSCLSKEVKMEHIWTCFLNIALYNTCTEDMYMHIRRNVKLN